MEKALTVNSKLSSGKIGVDNRFLFDTNFESMRLTSCLDLHCLRGSPSPSTCKYSKETRNIQRDLMQSQRRHKGKKNVLRCGVGRKESLRNVLRYEVAWMLERGGDSSQVEKKPGHSLNSN